MSETTSKLEVVDRVTCRWDAQAGARAGWYAEAFIGDTLLIDSEKIDFPVDLGTFDDDDMDVMFVESLLMTAFPNAKVEMAE